MLCESRNGFSHLAIQKELKRTQEISRKTKDRDSSVIQKRDCYTYLEKIAILEDAIVDTSNKVDHRALTLKDSMDGVLKMSSSIEKCWAWLSQVSQMAQLHLKNASTFHVFYAHCRELKTALDAPPPSHSKFLAQRTLRANLFEIDRKSALMGDRLTHYMQLCQQAERLISSCQAVVPIHLRAERVCQPIKAILLCKLDTLEAKVEANEAVLLLDNSDRATWTVEVQNGAQLKVPAVALLVPGPDSGAVELAFSLRDKLYIKWKDELEMAQSLIIDLLQSLINDIVEGSIWVDNACLESLLRTLTEVELDLTFDTEGAGGTVFVRQLQACREVLERPEGLPPQNPRAANLSPEDVRAMSNLISCFKEHVKNCRQLKKQLRRKRPTSVPDMPPLSPHPSDVEKMMQRLSDSSSPDSPFGEQPDASAPSQQPKCVSRMHWNVPAVAPPGLERFVDTAEVPNHMGITVREEKKQERFRSTRHWQVQESKILGDFSVKLFHVARATGGQSIAVQTEEKEMEMDFDCGDVISAKRARGQHAAAPPPRRIVSDESWTQTDAKTVTETQVVFTKAAKESSSQTDAQKKTLPTSTASQTFSIGTYDMKTQTDTVTSRSWGNQTESPRIKDTLVIYSPRSDDTSAQTQPPRVNAISCQTDAPVKAKVLTSWSQTTAPGTYEAKTQTDTAASRSFGNQTESKRMQDAQMFFRSETYERTMQTERSQMQETSAETMRPDLRTVGFQTEAPPRRDANRGAQTDPMVFEVVSRVQIAGETGPKAKVVDWHLLPKF